MTNATLILLLMAFTIKHFIFDFAYQPPWMYQNKGTYGHLGGIAHSWLHSLATAVILPFFTANFLLILGLVALEFVIHYHMDWFKMWYNKKQGWTATTHNEFWVLMGLDQFVHSMTYLVLACLLLG